MDTVVIVIIINGLFLATSPQGLAARLCPGDKSLVTVKIYPSACPHVNVQKIVSILSNMIINFLWYWIFITRTNKSCYFDLASVTSRFMLYHWTWARQLYIDFTKIKPTANWSVTSSRSGENIVRNCSISQVCCGSCTMKQQDKQEKQADRRQTLHRLCSASGLLLSVVCCIALIHVQLTIQEHHRLISNSVTFCDQMKTEILRQVQQNYGSRQVMATGRHWQATKGKS